MLSDQTKYTILQQKFSLETQFNLLAAALKSLDKIIAMDEAKADLAIYLKYKQDITAFINGNHDIVVRGELGNDHSWYYPLVRHQFSLQPVKGHIQKLDIRCANKRHVFAVGNEKTWNIPKQWQQCTVYVYGDGDATFKLIEHNSNS